MAQLLPNGRQQFLDANGNPLAGGLVYFYIPNTTTPKDTWQDAAKSALNTNPVVCDARGQATIYGEGDYRQILQDAQGNQIWDKDVSAPVPPYVFEQGSEPTTDAGDIWINGIGPCRWDATDSRYYRIGFQNRTVFTISGTFSSDAYTKTVRISGVGGGGGGGGGAGSVNTQSLSGGGAGAGANAVSVEQVITPGATISVTIGAGGAGGAGGPTGTAGVNGSDGGSTTFGAYLTLPGGKKGLGASNTNAGAPGGSGGNSSAASGGDGLGMNGQSGTSVSSLSGAGASSPFGVGGASVRSTDSSNAGQNGTGYGSGGSGGAGPRSTTSSVVGGKGGTGAPGILIVEW